jgi:chromosome partitioning protein
MPTTIAFANNKGGTGKTTVTIQTAAALARTGRRVLVVDMDPQGNATTGLGVTYDPAAPWASLSEAIKANTDGEPTAGQAVGCGAGIVQRCGWVDDDGTPTAEAALIDVLPARLDLGNRESEAHTDGAVERLRKVLQGWTDAYDAVLIDTRPDLGHLVKMAFAAANYVVLVTTASERSVEGAVRVVDFINTKSAYIFNPGLQLGGVVINNVDRTSEARAHIANIVALFGDKVWSLRTATTIGDTELERTPAFIPHWTRFSEAEGARYSLSGWADATGRKTTALYNQLAAHLLPLLAPKAAAAPTAVAA